jgi:hypothetical protein
MSTKGVNLGGVHTLADIKARCEEVGECWEWQAGTQNQGRTPFVKYGNRTITTRRLAWIFSHGKKPDGMLIMSKCDNPLCVKPAHLVAMTKSEARAMMAPKADSLLRRSRISASKRASSHITPEVAMQAQTMEGTSRTVAAALGISAATVTAIRRGDRRQVNIWSGLLGA